MNKHLDATDEISAFYTGILSNTLLPSTQQIAELSSVLGKLLIARNELITTVESCTGGMLASSIVDIAGSSKYFHAGLVTYGNIAKMQYAGVSKDVLKQHGAVSAPVVEEMVRGALRNEPKSSMAIGISGVAGPHGGNEVNPVGSVWFAINHIKDQMQSVKFNLRGDRTQVRQKTVAAALAKACLVLIEANNI